MSDALQGSVLVAAAMTMGVDGWRTRSSPMTHRATGSLVLEKLGPGVAERDIRVGLGLRSLRCS
jgi:hypothetical protein